MPRFSMLVRALLAILIRRRSYQIEIQILRMNKFHLTFLRCLSAGMYPNAATILFICRLCPGYLKPFSDVQEVKVLQFLS